MKKTLWTDILESFTGTKKKKIAKLNQQRKAVAEVREALDHVNVALKITEQYPENVLSVLAYKCKEFHGREWGEEMMASQFAPYDRDIASPKLMQDIADITKTMIQRHSVRTVSWENYQSICQFSPQASNLWREYPSQFEQAQPSDIDLISAFMPKEVRSKPQLSKDESLYIGAYSDVLDAFPLAEVDAKEDDIYYTIGEYEGNKEELTEEIIDDFVYERPHLLAVDAFIIEAEEIHAQLKAKHFATTSAPSAEIPGA